MRAAVTSYAAAAVLATAVVGCSASGPRVIVRNDSAQTQHVFYCDNDPCTLGIGGNDVVLKPGEEAQDYWNSPDPTGPIGIAAYPGDRLIGCLSNPSEGQDNPPTRMVLTSHARPCTAAAPARPQVQITNP
ncbi:MAG: hypothetical protein QOE89_1481 [Pseudonocardiales bacterium]|nr:hypothetical protein [Pseudonocardiales bacterium]